MDALFSSFILIAVAEMGDKTQLLAFILASRFRQPWAILAGILVGVLANHLLAASLGNWISQVVPATYLKWSLIAILLIFALWTLLPDKNEHVAQESRFGAFLTTAIAYFLVEMGDKSQISTMVLAAKYQNTLMVTMGSTLGSLAADGLAIFFGDKVRQVISLKWIRVGASGMFILFAIAILLGY